MKYVMLVIAVAILATVLNDTIVNTVNSVANLPGVVLEANKSALDNVVDVFVPSAQAAPLEPVGLLGLTRGCMSVGNAVQVSPIMPLLPPAKHDDRTWLGKLIDSF